MGASIWNSPRLFRRIPDIARRQSFQRLAVNPAGISKISDTRSVATIQTPRHYLTTVSAEIIFWVHKSSPQFGRSHIPRFEGWIYAE